MRLCGQASGIVTCLPGKPKRVQSRWPGCEGAVKHRVLARPVVTAGLIGREQHVGVETRAVAGVAGAVRLVHLDQNGVPVAVERDGFH